MGGRGGMDNSTKQSSFPSIFRDSQSAQQRPTRSHSPSNDPSRSITANPLNRGNINNLRHFRGNSNLSQEQQQNNKALSLIKWFINWCIIRIFSGYPISIQSIITSIIGFIAYFLYDYAIDSESIHSYILYKTLSFIGFGISVSLLYLLYLNITKPSLSNNPYSAPLNQSSHSTHSTHSNLSKRDDLYFANKTIPNPFNVEPKNMISIHRRSRLRTLQRIKT